MRNGFDIFICLFRAASEPSPELVTTAFSLVQVVYNEYFEHSLYSFNDFVYCLGQFAFNHVNEDISLNAMHLLQTCALQVREGLGEGGLVC